MATVPSNVRRFQEAMQRVYGPIAEAAATPQAAERWVPPDKPGAGGHRGRYLWTDAFGVLNLITLYRETGSATYLQLARRLVRTVHDVLGSTRDGSSRLPGATDAEPLRGGLRIGKAEARGPDGDGQYHHYLTLWMFALNRLALAAGEPAYNALAVQLAEAVHPRFVLRGPGGEAARMVWKVSADMREVLVPSEGHLDAATGYVVCGLLREAAERFGQTDRERQPVLENEMDDYRELMGRGGGRAHMAASRDMLDLGMGLWACHFLRDKEEWAAKLGGESVEIAKEVLREGGGGILAKDPGRRLAFREFGTCLGLRCYNNSFGGEDGRDEGLEERVAALVGFWEKYMEESLDEEDLRPITLVMYAAALIPGAFQRGYFDDKAD
ncbi:Vacuolar amino acid transporter 3 [Pleurostoma richardsiae]|uniref:Vacuolar amino acid transporter 3 n=1 Tax=Pleurostoma richardsiae TaxID=41990 RepID=A0AA38RN40_9PEZI|nr:Vacuolar amino acid transporter 3 [Pleurostoma richardsiae]